MPELPEVETTCRGIRPHLLGQCIKNTEIRNRHLRWPIENCVHNLKGQIIQHLHRRAKYLLLTCETGTLILHLGMSGSLRICPHETELRKHDHFILRLHTGMELRLHDPRRFGAVIWCKSDPASHPLLKHLGPEPLSDEFDPSHLANACKGRKTSIKQLIMNNKIVVGVGNIYACEALFLSGIHPTRAAGRISQPRLIRLVRQIKDVLSEAIKQGGTTLRDFLREDGNPGYFKQSLNVYDREGLACRKCGAPLKRILISSRSTFYCPRCQR